MDRTILHCDCNNFFASVEENLDPSLREAPMAVGGSEENRHGIILAKNQLAKKYGIKTAETIWQAKKKCPNLVIVPPHHSLYKEYSEEINKIYEEYTDLVEPFSIDESYLDVTGSRRLFGDGKTIADTLRKRVHDEIGITISVGASFNKIFAKLGSDYKKPDATTVITKENFKSIVYPLSADNLMSVGRSCYAELKKLGIYTIGDIAACQRDFLEKHFGKAGTQLYIYANGLDDEPVKSFYEKTEAKSIGNSITFSRNLVSMQDIVTGTSAIAEMVGARMRKHHVQGSTVQIGIKYDDFKYISRQKTLLNPTNISKEIEDNALELILHSISKGKPIRLLSIQMSHLTAEEGCARQLSLFGEEDKTYEKRQKLDVALDKIRDKFGKNAVSTGSIMTSDIGLKSRTKED